MLANVPRGPTAAINVQCHRTGEHRNRCVLVRLGVDVRFSDTQIAIMKGQDQDEFVEKIANG
jgi:hypothetical protein